MIDVNVTLSRCPFRRLPLDETPKLVDKLAAHGVDQAWAGSFDALLHKDLTDVNRRLAAECREFGERLLPFGSVNPKLPDWQTDLKRCHEEHGMRGIRLHPNYHGYSLDEPEFAELLGLADERGLIVQLVVMMEDERTQHPLLSVPHVDTEPLLELLPSFPELRLVVLNGLRTLRGAAITRLAQAGQVGFDVATQESVGGIGKLIKLVPFERVLFGSHAPFYYFEAAKLKLRESELGDFVERAIVEGNAAKLLDR